MELKKLLKNKKGIFGNINNMVLGMIMLIILAVIAVQLITEVKSTQDVNSAAYNMSGYGERAFISFGKLFPIIGTLLGLAIVLTILYMFLPQLGGGGGGGGLGRT